MVLNGLLEHLELRELYMLVFRSHDVTINKPRLRVSDMVLENPEYGLIWPRGYKTVFLLNSAKHEIFIANKYDYGNNSWHFHIC